MIKPKILSGLICIVLGMTLAGCSGNNEEAMNMQAAADSSMLPIKVELSWSPEEISVNDKVMFKAVISQDGEVVEDAKEVIFEIVDNAEPGKSTQLKGASDGEGAYVSEGTFEHAGSYTVTSHVTARTQHSMPSKELTVQP